jgi:signal transduction histidine kinase
MSRLVGLLALAAIVPLAIVATVLLIALWRSEQAQLAQATRAAAQVAAASIEQRLDRELERLRTLEGAPPPGVERIQAGATPLAPHRERVLRGQTAVSNLIDRGVEVGVPVIEHGKVAYGLLARLESRELSALLRAQLRHPDGVAAVVDSERRIIAHSGEADRWIGRPLGSPLDEALLERRSGEGRWPAGNGAEDAYGAWTRVAGTPWTVIVGTPAALAEAAAARSLGALAALLVAVLLASSLFAWLVGRRILHAAGEAQALATELESSTTRLAAADAERRHAESERDRRLAEESRARRVAESASRAKDEFLAMLGHELRNPLGAIGNAVRVIDRLPSTSADHKAAREIIGRQTEHLAKIVDDLLDVGRVVSGRIALRRSLLDLAQATAAAVGTARAAAPQQYDWILELAPVLVSADATRIDQVLANLLDNAVKFTPAGGQIAVRLRPRGGEAVLTIEDTGPGIRPELLPEVFDLFAKEGLAPEHGGLGIGLTLVRRIVELHGGAVSAENRAEGGARFVVHLPAIPEPAPAERPPRPLPSPVADADLHRSPRRRARRAW